MSTIIHVRLVQTGPVRFTATNAAGTSTMMDGPLEMGGTNAGLRPMEMLLSALAGCSSIDVIHIMKKQRQGLKRLEVEVDGTGRHDSCSVHPDPPPIHGSRLHRLTQIPKSRGASDVEVLLDRRILQPKVAITADALLGINRPITHSCPEIRHCVSFQQGIAILSDAFTDIQNPFEIHLTESRSPVVLGPNRTRPKQKLVRLWRKKVSKQRGWFWTNGQMMSDGS